MKHWHYATVAVGVSLGVWLGVAATARSDSHSLLLSPGFSPDPLVMTGISGGTQTTPDCGFIKTGSPNLTVTLTDAFQFLQAAVTAAGDVTLLVEAPSGRRICSDDVNGLMPQISGAPPAGTYKIWIGDYQAQPDTGYSYQLTLTTKSDAGQGISPAP